MSVHIIGEKWDNWESKRSQKDELTPIFLQKDELTPIFSDTDFLALGLTQDGHPKHPLYLPKGAELVAFMGKIGVSSFFRMIKLI